MTKTIHSPGQLALIHALTRMRKEAGLSQTDLAAKLKCHQSMIARIESGERRIDVVELVVLARAIGTDPGNILREVEQMVPTDHRF